MNNIRQLTNFSSEVLAAPIVSHTVLIGNDHYETIDYYELSATILTGSEEVPVNKIGYVCEPKGIGYPIFIETGGTVRSFEIGKTGMFEAQTEVFRNINDTDAEEIECLPKITQVEVPKDMVFNLDYAFNVN